MDCGINWPWMTGASIRSMCLYHQVSKVGRRFLHQRAPPRLISYILFFGSRKVRPKSCHWEAKRFSYTRVQGSLYSRNGTFGCLSVSQRHTCIISDLRIFMASFGDADNLSPRSQHARYLYPVQNATAPRFDLCILSTQILHNPMGLITLTTTITNQHSLKRTLAARQRRLPTRESILPTGTTVYLPLNEHAIRHHKRFHYLFNRQLSNKHTYKIEK